MRKALCIHFIALLSAAGVALPASPKDAPPETLRHVLLERELPLPNELGVVVDVPVTSYAERNTAGEFVIAYYVDDGSGALRPPLMLLRYDKLKRHWQTGMVHEGEARIGGSLLSAGGINPACLGSALDIYHHADLFFVDTHINPSAGCLLVLDGRLRLKSAVFGWYLGMLSERFLLFHNSEVHFAPTHPMRISIYDLNSNAVRRVYPQRQDPLRAAYRKQLRRALARQAELAGANLAGNPRFFGSELADGRVSINEKTSAVVFVARYDSEGFAPQGRQIVPAESVLYVYQISPGNIRYREFPLAEAKRRFGTSSTKAMTQRGMLERVFGPR